MARSKAIRVRHLSLAQARASLNKIVQQSHGKGEYFFVGKQGAPVLGIMDAEEMEDYLELRDPNIRRRIQKSNEEYLAGKSRPFEEFLAELDEAKGKRARSPRRTPA